MSFSIDIMNAKYAHTKRDGTLETWPEIAYRTVTSVMRAAGYLPTDPLVVELIELVTAKKFMPGGRYLYAAGRPMNQTQNCLLLRAYDSREGWAELLGKASMALMTGAGIGIDYSSIRPEGSPIKKTGGYATGPLALMQMMNEVGRGIMNGGSRRSAIWAGLSWKHRDVLKFIEMKNWSPEVKTLKAANWEFPAPMDGTNISVQLDDEFFEAYHTSSHPRHERARTVYWKTIRQMCETSEPGFSVDTGANAQETLRNACCELTSADTDDICNIGSINLARVSTLSEFQRIVEVATAFLLAGTLYSLVPYPDVARVRHKNRRLGLGLMGIHEWLLVRGKPYGPDLELEWWLQEYEKSTSIAARYAHAWGISAPVKTRAIAPTGTIGIVAETTTGIEPMLYAAYRRSYIKNGQKYYQYVIDPAARRLVTEQGIDPDLIEDSAVLAATPERRVEFQSWTQRFVDHGISSTINLPAWGHSLNNENTLKSFGDMLIRYLPSLRGITCYADGSRAGQPIESVSYQEAIANEGVEYETGDVCSVAGGGTCGS